MDILQEATNLLKSFGYRIIKESTEGLDVSKIEDTAKAEKIIQNLLAEQDIENEKVYVNPSSTDEQITIQVADREYLICKDTDIAYDKAVNDEKIFLEMDAGLIHCGIDLKHFGRTWKEFLNLEELSNVGVDDVDEFDGDPSYEGIDWEDAKSVSEYFDDNFIDWKKVAEFCVDEDGIGHFLAKYDGIEIQLADGYLAYRTE